jgi:hypothetical protein
MKSIKSLLALGNLVVEIRSPANLPFLHEKRLKLFQTNAVDCDIRWEYQIIDMGAQDSETPVPQNDLLRARINHLGDGSKLMRKPQVQTRLEQARSHMEWLTIEIHQGAITLLDFKENRAAMFFSRKFATEIKNHGIGPSLLALFLPNFAACLLHASAVVRNGQTAVFLAPDEGGKTTAALLAPSGTILSDDQVLVSRFPDGFRVYGTPWGLHIDGKLNAPCSGIFLLEKTRNFALTPLTTREVVALIWEEVKNPLAILPTPLKKMAFELVCELAAEVPAWKMAFPQEYIDWKAIDNAMTGRRQTW